MRGRPRTVGSQLFSSRNFVNNERIFSRAVFFPVGAVFVFGNRFPAHWTTSIHILSVMKNDKHPEYNFFHFFEILTKKALIWVMIYCHDVVDWFSCIYHFVILFFGAVIIRYLPSVSQILIRTLYIYSVVGERRACWLDGLGSTRFCSVRIFTLSHFYINLPFVFFSFCSSFIYDRIAIRGSGRSILPTMR